MPEGLKPVGASAVGFDSLRALLITLGCCAGLIAVTYPLQYSRAWRTAIFPPPARLNIDAPEWLAIVEDSPFLAHTLPMHVSRPLYPGPAYAVKQFVWTSASPLLLLRILNLLWLGVALLALYYFTSSWTRSSLAAGLATILFCVSPCVQIYLSQPVPTIIGCAAAIVPPALAAWAAQSKRRAWKWIVTGVASAILILGKEVYAVYLCLALIAVWRRAYVPLLLFAVGAAVIHLSWLAWVYWGIHRLYAPYGANQAGFVSWIWTDFAHRKFGAQVLYLVRLLARVILRVFQAFEIWPVLLAGVGFWLLQRKPMIEVAAYKVSFFAMFFAMNLVTPRICFLMFPIVYPLAAFAIVHVAFCTVIRSHVLAAAWIACVAVLIALSALCDPYAWFYYG